MSLVLASSPSLDEVAIRDALTVLSWREVDDLVNRVITTLYESGFEPGRRVAVLGENSVETVLAHLAGQLAGAATVPINFHLKVGEIEHILRDSGAQILLVGPEHAAVGAEAASELPRCTVLGWRLGGDHGVQDWSASDPDERVVGEAERARPCPNILYTSGTTGVPKATELPPTMFAGGSSVAEHVELLRTQSSMASGSSTVPGTHLVVGPLYHTGPLCAYRLLAGGTPLVVRGRFDAEQTLAAIEEHSIASTSMVPTHFRRLLALPEATRQGYDVSSLQHVWTTGSACPPAIKKAMIDWWGPIVSEAYGATEVGTVTSITASEWLTRMGSVGRCIPPFEARVVGFDGSDCAPGEVGILYFRDKTGRGVVYLDDPEKTAAAHLEPGVFTLGEVGYLDVEGYVYVTDRAVDMVISGGVNIYPAEIESALFAHPGVQDVAVIGVPDDDMGETVMALIVRSPGSRIDEAELIAFCRGRIAHYKCPTSVRFVGSLERSEVGKVDKRRLRAPFWPTARTIG